MRRKIITAIIFSCLGTSMLSAHAQTLENVISQTLKTNPRITISKSQLLQTEEDYMEAKAGYMPSVDADGTYGPERSLNFSTNEQYVTMARKEIGGQAKLNLFKGYGDYYSVAGNKARVYASKFQLSNTRENLALEAIQVYLDVIRDQQLVAIAKVNVDRHRYYVQMIERRAEQGLGREADIAPAQGRLALALNNLYSEENRYEDSVTDYERIVNEKPTGLRMPKIPQSYTYKTIAKAIDVALDNHPAIKSAKANIIARGYQIKVAHSTFYPQLDFVLAAHAGKNLDGIEGDDNEQSALLRLSYNLYRGGADLARERKAAYQKMESFAELRDTEREVVGGVGLSWNALMTSREELEVLYQHQVRSQETVEAYRKQFALGKRTLVDLLNAESEYFNSQRAYTAGKFDLLLNECRLLNSMGVLLQAFKLR